LVDARDYRALRYLFTLAKWAFDGAGAKGVQIITRLDIGHWECGRMRTLDGQPTACYKAKDFNSARAADLLRPVVDRWVVGHVHLHGAQHLVGEYNRDDVMFDEYTGSGSQVTHRGEFAGLAWTARRLGIEGRVVFHAGYLDPATATGEGTFYDARKLGFVGVLASRRVKLWRDAVNDYDLLVLASRRNPKGTAALSSGLLATSGLPALISRPRTAVVFKSLPVSGARRLACDRSQSTTRCECGTGDSPHASRIR